MGPMAQDFKQTFFPGTDDKSLNTLDMDGVQMAALKGLHQVVKEKDAELQAVKGELKELRAMLESLAKAKAAGAQ
jgi:predicted RNA binding protein YcfA (HicA-like mRNA interferase family)